MEICHVCGSKKISRYAYNNHNNNILSVVNLKFFLKKIFCELAKLLNLSFYEKIKYKILFSPLSKINRCENCGYGVYINKKLNDQILKDYYLRSYWQSGGMPYEKWHDPKFYLENKRAIGQFNCVREHLNKIKNVDLLEIGAAKAYFIRYAQKKHSGKIVGYVVEPGQGWDAYYNELGIKKIASFYPFETDIKFDYIHTSHWLEHGLDVRNVIKSLRKNLTRKGLLFIEVPNCNLEYFSMDVRDAPHIHFFTKKSLGKLLQDSGFKIISLEEYGLTWGEEKNLNRMAAKQERRQEAISSEEQNSPSAGGSLLRGLFQVRDL